MTSTDSRQVIIDDTDRRIQYTGPGWFLDSSGSQDGIGNFGPTYQHTLHGTRMNSSLSFSFKGTHVNVMGTINIKNASGIHDPTWECFVDNVSISPNLFKFPENIWRLCSTEGLKDGPHDLTVNIASTGQTFWLDSILYSPSPGLSLEPATALQIDNTDPQITYDSGWHELNDSINITRTFGSTASFSFSGTHLSWIGFIPSDLPQIPSQGTYSIDGGSQVSFRLNGLPTGTDTELYNQEFFSTGVLSAGLHTLRVTYQGNESQTPLTLDYLRIMTNSSPPSNPPSGASTSSTTNPNTTTNSNTNPNPTNTNANPNPNTNTNTNTNTNPNPSPSTNTNISTSTSTSTSTNTSTSISISINQSSSVPSPKTHNQPVGAIAGGVVGGTAFIVLTLIALLFWYRRRNGHAWRSDTESFVTPYSYDGGSEHVIEGYNPMLGTSQTKGIVIQPGPIRLSVHKSGILRASPSSGSS